MIHRIEFTINIETNNLSNEDYMKLQEPFYLKIVDDKMPSITFEELVKLLNLDKKKFYPSSIEFPEMTHEDFVPKTTKIEIKG